MIHFTRWSQSNTSTFATSYCRFGIQINQFDFFTCLFYYAMIASFHFMEVKLFLMPITTCYTQSWGWAPPFSSKKKFQFYCNTYKQLSSALRSCKLIHHQNDILLLKYNLPAWTCVASNTGKLETSECTRYQVLKKQQGWGLIIVVPLYMNKPRA